MCTVIFKIFPSILFSILECLVSNVDHCLFGHKLRKVDVQISFLFMDILYFSSLEKEKKNLKMI